MPCSRPTWLPWSDRIAPGDLGPGDLLPIIVEDPRLEPGYEATDDEDADQLAFWELGLGRERVLSPEGRAEAAERWYDGTHGPHTPIAELAPAPCASCGFFLPMAGTLRAVFGVCSNEWSPSDGQVVSLDHGCGAHSQGGVTVDDAAGRAAHPRRARLRRAAAPRRPGGRVRGPRPAVTGRDPFDTASVRERVLAAWTASPARLREDANAEEDLSLGGYRDRVVVELAQNAADAARRGRPARPAAASA